MCKGPGVEPTLQLEQRIKIQAAEADRNLIRQGLVSHIILGLIKGEIEGFKTGQ